MQIIELMSSDFEFGAITYNAVDILTRRRTISSRLLVPNRK